MRLITLPFTLARRGLDLAVGVVTGAVERLVPHDDAERPQPAGRPEPAPTPAPAPEPRVTPAARPPAPPAIALDEPAPPEPIHTPEPEPEVVAVSADPGAADGPGPSIHVDEPWPGYAGMKAGEITDRLAVADPATLGAVQLYESAHRARRSVLAETQRRLALA